jgi:predicted enzyme related to lactoylglutathione lyase
MSALPNPVGWFEIYVADMARAQKFYEAVFQRPLSPLSPPGADYEMLAFAMDSQGAGASGALVRHPMKGPAEGGTLVYFSCEDCANESARVLAHGGTVHRPKTSIGPFGFIAIVGDTEGNVIGLHSGP